MKQIWKYRVPTLEGTFKLSMPDGAKVLSVAVQRNTVQMWALVKPNLPTTQREFLVAATGEDILVPLGEFIGTFLIHREMVFHLWEVT